MNERFAIVTDSTSDIQPEMAEARQIALIPLHIIWGGKNLRDGVDITRQAFYERLAVDPELPTTSQPSPGEYADALQRARDQADAQAVFALTISSALSGTFTSATQAAEMVDFPVHVIDSRTASGALGLQALALADARDRGLSVEEALPFAQQLPGRTRATLTVDTLDYLHRSGRVSHLRHWIGTALHIRPILHVADGRIVPLHSARGRQKSLAVMLDNFNQWVDPERPLHVIILHGNCIEDADRYEAQLVERWQPAFIMKALASATVGAVTGPRAMGLTLFQ